MRLSTTGSLHRLFALASVLVLVLAACSNSPPPAVPGEDHEHAHHGEHGGHEHGDGEHGGHEHGEGEHHHGGHHVEGPLKDFHEVIAPVWHSEPGAKRVEAACSNVAKLKETAGPLATPAGAAQKDEAGWKADVATLGTNIDALTTACGAAGRPDVESTLSKVHDGFHKLMERVE